MQGGEQKATVKVERDASKETSRKGLARQLELGVTPPPPPAQGDWEASGSIRRDAELSLSVGCGQAGCAAETQLKDTRAEVRGPWGEVKRDAYTQEVLTRQRGLLID